MTDQHLHPSERAAVYRDVLTTPPPGTLEEADALRAIDHARHEETTPLTRAQARRRARAHWKDRDHALGR